MPGESKILQAEHRGFGAISSSEPGRDWSPQVGGGRCDLGSFQEREIVAFCNYQAWSTNFSSEAWICLFKVTFLQKCHGTSPLNHHFGESKLGLNEMADLKAMTIA